MKAIVIGAGRGARLMPYTEEKPKGLVEIRGRRILDWTLDALAAGGVNDVVYVGGWQIDAVRRAYPTFRYVHNVEWESNNILASLFFAEHEMDGGFISTYGDILYKPHAVEKLAASPHDITIVVDTKWRARYGERSQHPESDGEKCRCDGERVIEVSRRVPSGEAYGEFIGVAKFSELGVEALRTRYRERVAAGADKPLGDAPTLRRAYLIHLLQDLIEHGVEIHKVDTAGDYIEVDTGEDFVLANRDWR